MNIVLGVSGGIAAYKAPELVRRLRDIGADVRVILTPNAARFVSPLALAAVSDHGVIVEQWGDPERGGVDHIELARWAELLLVAPATANTLAKLAAGIADDALTTYALAHRAEVLAAPAMNTFMLAHPTVRQNIETLRARGVGIIEPVNGLLACGEEGAGKMPDVPELVNIVRERFVARDLVGQRVLVTAGPTREPLDPVRYLSNRSSGKMGYAIADAARRRGAQVTLVSGPTSVIVPAGVELTRVTTAEEMHAVVMEAATEHQILIKAAAVADFSPVRVADRKIKKREGEDTLTIELRKNPDILADVAKLSPRPFIVAFAAETDMIEQNAREKLERKGADLIVANDVADATIGFDSNENEVLVIGRDGALTRIARASKLAIANGILDAIVARLPLHSHCLKAHSSLGSRVDGPCSRIIARMFLAALLLATAIDAKELETLVDKTITTEMARQKIPGAAFILVQDGRVVLAKGYGPITPDTIVPIASITKVFTALAVVELGIDLDADVNQYLTSVKVPPGPKVTAKHLLTHTAGFDELRGRMIDADNLRAQPLGEFLKTRLVRVHPPGELTSYSSFGITLAGALVEDVSGLPYERYLVTKIFAPLKMNRTQITVPDELLDDRAEAYEDGPIPWERYHSTPASSISSTASDMGRFMIALLRDDRLSREQVTMHPRLPGFGYGIQYADTNGQRIVEHGGNIGGFHSLMTLLPGHDAAFFVVAHREGADLRSPVRKAILDRWFPGPAPVRPAVEPNANVKRYEGTYRGSIWCHTCPFDPDRVSDARVTANADGTLQLWDDQWIEVEPRFFRSADGTRRIGFAEDKDGKIIALTAGSWMVMERLK